MYKRQEEEIAQESTESTIRQTETIVPSVEIIPDSEWKEEENKRIEGAKMLIVEDNESIKQMLAGIFETFYQVSTASDGEEALEMIQKEMPSIIPVSYKHLFRMLYRRLSTRSR